MLTLTEVPPPEETPTNQTAMEFGVLSCLRVSPDCDMYRCVTCHEMQKPGSPQVWVTDGIRIGDPVWSVQEISRRSAFNGHSSAWCIQCARKLGQDKEASPTPKKVSGSWWRRIFRSQ